MSNRDSITLFQGKWGNIFLEWNFRTWDIIPRLIYSTLWGYADLLIFGILCFRIQLTLWSKTMRESLAKDDHYDTI